MSKLGPIGRHLVEKLSRVLAASHLEVVCESHMHNVPKGSEKHFYVQIVCPQFEGVSVLKRHRLVNECLAEELASSVHALRIDAIPPSKWEGQAPTNAPACRGGGSL